MLYVVSLFGTVTGYYLGRVPAEVNARRAETAARDGSAAVVQSQEKLGAATVGRLDGPRCRGAGVEAAGEDDRRAAKCVGGDREAASRLRRGACWGAWDAQ